MSTYILEDVKTNELAEPLLYDIVAATLLIVNIGAVVMLVAQVIFMYVQAPKVVNVLAAVCHVYLPVEPALAALQ